MAVLATHFLELTNSFAHSLLKHMRARMPNSERHIFINRQHKTEEIQPVHKAGLIFLLGNFHIGWDRTLLVHTSNLKLFNQPLVFKYRNGQCD